MYGLQKDCNSEKQQEILSKQVHWKNHMSQNKRMPHKKDKYRKQPLLLRKMIGGGRETTKDFLKTVIVNQFSWLETST